MNSFSFFLTYWYVLSHESDALEWKRLFEAGWNSSHFFKNYSKVMKKKSRKTRIGDSSCQEHGGGRKSVFAETEKDIFMYHEGMNKPSFGLCCCLRSVHDKPLLLSAVRTQVSLHWSWHSCPSSPWLLQVLVSVSFCMCEPHPAACCLPSTLFGRLAQLKSASVLRAWISDTAAWVPNPFLLLLAPKQMFIHVSCFAVLFLFLLHSLVNRYAMLG